MDLDSGKGFPFKIEDVEPEANAQLIKYYTGEPTGFVRVGPKGYILTHKYKEHAASFYNMEVRPDDVFIITYPRSGTTLTQELVWLVANDADFATAEAVDLLQRSPFLELNILMSSYIHNQLKEENKESEEKLKFLDMVDMSPIELLKTMPSPRFIKSHLPLSLLPPSLLDTAKVVFVARDPRDVAVSFYHHNRLTKLHGFTGDFKTYWNLFIKDLIYYTPFFEFNKEAWAKRHHPNMLFLFYEELSKDMPGAVHRVSKFLGKQLSEQQVDQLCEHLKFDNFKNNKSVNMDSVNSVGVFNTGEQSFIRKGKAGGWRDYFDAEMTEQAERWIADNLRGSDFHFPHMDKH